MTALTYIQLLIKKLIHKKKKAFTTPTHKDNIVYINMIMLI